MAKFYPHGTNRRYSINRCRCTDCRAAHAAEAHRRRRAIGYGRWQGLVDAAGTIRRIRALTVIGFSCAHIARLRSVTKYVVQDLAFGLHQQVQAATAKAYAEIYDELCVQDGPNKRISNWAKNDKGWHGPEAWTDDTIDDPEARPFQTPIVDQVAVRRAVKGQARYGELSEPDRIAAYRRMVADGLGRGGIQERLHINADTYQRLVNLAATSGEVAA